MNNQLINFINRWFLINEPNWRNDNQLTVKPYIRTEGRDTRFYGGLAKWYVRSIINGVKNKRFGTSNLECEAIRLSAEERLTHPIIDLQITIQILEEIETDLIKLLVINGRYKYELEKVIS